MKIGVCGGIERIKSAAECGFDYFEAGFGVFASSDSEAYNNLKSELKKYGLPCEASNSFIPGEIKIVGNDVDYDCIESYLIRGYERAAELGVKTVVLGSGYSRMIPENYPYNDAVNDIIRFVKLYAAPLAAQYDMMLVLEPICKEETNIINTVSEGAMLASAINMPNVAALADLYHMHKVHDTYADIQNLRGMIRHAHISNPIPNDKSFKRIYMKCPDEYDYKGFFDALKYAGCERISIEAQTADFESDAREAVKIMNMYK